MALEVVALRRDGFDGEIELAMEGLPEGVTAHGLKIPAGQSRGMMLITAQADAPARLRQRHLLGTSDHRRQADDTPVPAGVGVVADSRCVGRNTQSPAAGRRAGLGQRPGTSPTKHRREDTGAGSEGRREADDSAGSQPNQRLLR